MLHRSPTLTASVVCLVAAASLACGASSDDATPVAATERAAPPKPTTNLADRYRSFRDDGCDASAVDSPAAVRVLRNLPFAIAGRTFKSADLSEAFARDGGWYAPGAEEPVVDETDGHCVEKLREREAVLATVHCMEADTLANLTQDPKVLAWHLDGGMAGLVGPPNDWDSPTGNGFQACDAPEWAAGGPEGTHVRWTVEVLRDVDTDAASTKLVAATLPTSTLLVDALKKDMTESLATLEDTAMTCLVVEARGETRHPEEYFPWASARTCCGTGPFMADTWICASGSAP